ncbi:hypothetical protein [Nostoc sp.]|uniref:hypothetical protein n=1 Tax=Nostoc sp. TaxID=1180 RepID=UPI002FF73BA4
MVEAKKLSLVPRLWLGMPIGGLLPEFAAEPLLMHFQPEARNENFVSLVFWLKLTPMSIAVPLQRGLFQEFL